LAMSTAYHPTTDGQTERINRVLEEMLRSFVRNSPVLWDEYLAKAAFAYNNAVNESTGYTPFFLNFGRHPTMPATLSVSTTTGTPDVDEFVSSMQKCLQHARSSLHAAQAKQKRYADRKRRDVSYEVGDQVLLASKNYPLYPGIPVKLQLPWVGPFVITRKISKNNYVLDLKSSKYSTFHVSVLRTYLDGSEDFPDRNADVEPPPVIVRRGQAYYVPERVVKRKSQKGVSGYMVAWKGYSEPEWMDKAWAKMEIPGLVEAFEASHPRRRGGPRRSGRGR
jgi:hypothetical protein